MFEDLRDTACWPRVLLALRSPGTRKVSERWTTLRSEQRDREVRAEQARRGIIDLGGRRAHSALGPMWYSKTNPATVPRISAAPTATSHHWSRASAKPSTVADSPIPNGQ